MSAEDSYPASIGGEYEFEVGKKFGRYVIQLPHSCDNWVVAESKDKATTVAEAETFIAEAQAALEKLKEQP